MMKTERLGWLFFYCGLSAAFPLFLVPSSPFVYINHIEDIKFVSNIHPSYTGSLGFSLPFPLVGITLAYTSLVSVGKLNFLHDRIQMSIFMILAVYLLSASSSLKSMAFSSSIFAAYFAIRLSTTKLGNYFLRGFFLGLIVFVVLHACSILIYGAEFSSKTEGISIFGIEIYQALISYSATIALLFGVLLIQPRLIDTVFPSLQLRNKALFAILILTAIIIIQISVSRRAAFLVMIGALVLFCFLHIFLRFGKRSLFAISIMVIALVMWLMNTYVFTNVKSLDWAHMVQPRLNVYSSAVRQLAESGPIGIIFGSSNGWAVHHNTFLDVLTHSGLVGVFLVALCLHQLFSKYFQQYKENFDLNKKLVVFFILSVLMFDNTVNTMFSVPYYSVSSMALLALIINQRSHSEFSESVSNANLQ